jgi:hypothetical protein
MGLLRYGLGTGGHHHEPSFDDLISRRQDP